MKKTLVLLLVSAVFTFFGGYYYGKTNLYEAAYKEPRGSLNIPSQWFMMDSKVGWEKMMLIFGYADNVEVCSHLMEVAKEESPDRDFRCTDAN